MAVKATPTSTSMLSSVQHTTAQKPVMRRAQSLPEALEPTKVGTKPLFWFRPNNMSKSSHKVHPTPRSVILLRRSSAIQRTMEEWLQQNALLEDVISNDSSPSTFSTIMESESDETLTEFSSDEEDEEEIYQTLRGTEFLVD